MVRILPDREVKNLLGKVILGGSPECVGPNSYELRLGRDVKFDSTGEEMDIPDGHFLEIQPGDFVTISSSERLDFSRSGLDRVPSRSNLMGLITPTTTMMREGFLFTTTKVDPGFRGTLNWGIRNSSTKPVRLKQGERLFKLTVFELGDDENPDRLYGEDPKDAYQGSDGIKPSARMIPANIPEKLVVRRSEKKIDPNRQLIEAGYPFSHIGTELVNLHGKFEVVSTEVRLLKDEFQKMQAGLEGKIDAETNTLSEKLEQLTESLGKKITEKFDELFSKKMVRVYGTLAAIASFAVAIYRFVAGSTPPSVPSVGLRSYRISDACGYTHPESRLAQGPRCPPRRSWRRSMAFRRWRLYS
jgi:deoxycytidine triphosphate deaminase